MLYTGYKYVLKGFKMKRFNIVKIQKKMYESYSNQCTCKKRVKQKIIDDYNLDKNSIISPKLLADAIINLLDQKTIEDPESKQYSNIEVFENAVKAIGSNSRKWATFLAFEGDIKKLLSCYNPERINITGDLEKKLIELLKGQTCSKDAKAIIKWAERLCDSRKIFYESVKRLYYAVINAAGQNSIKLRKHEVTLCIICLLAKGSIKKWNGLKVLEDDHYFSNGNNIKLHGMGFALASEFLRNMGWNAFKPDRHIIRLFNHWKEKAKMRIPSEEDYRIKKIREVIGRNDQETIDFLRYSLAGFYHTPNDYTYSQVDNLIWMLGAYVETKGNESNENYLI